MKKRKLLSVLSLTAILSLSLPTLSYAASEPTFSEYWYQDGVSNWHINDGDGSLVKNAWLCDDVIDSNGKDIWYLIDTNGNMISAGLVQDQTGNYYSLETSHAGYYGMLRYKSGVYDGVYLELESSHDGSFAKIKNGDGIEALKEKYGVLQVSIDNNNCIYTSNFNNYGVNSNNTNNSVNTKSPNTTSNIETEITNLDAITKETQIENKSYKSEEERIDEALEKYKDKCSFGGDKGIEWNR